MINKYEELSIDIDRFIINIIERVTGGQIEKNFDYELERKKLLENSLTKDLVPNFIKTYRTIDLLWSYIKDEFGTYAGRRKYVREEFEDMVEKIEQLQYSDASVSVDTLLKLGNEQTYIQVSWDKAKSKIESDPEGAITSARTLLESCLKYILDSLDIKYKDNGDLNLLYKHARKELNLSPDQHSEDDFIKVLSGCTSVVGGLAGIRNNLGDSHGKKIKHYKPSSRHAKLVVNLAGAMSEFVIDTYCQNFRNELNRVK